MPFSVLKYLAYVVIVLAMPCADLKSQIVRVRTDSLPSVHSPTLNPGFFYNNTTTAANSIFNGSGLRCNSLRLSDAAWYVRSSTSLAQALSNIRAMRSLYQLRAASASKVIIELSGMPLWLSNSGNTASTCSGWYHSQTVKPSSYVRWDSLMRAIAMEISTWGIAPHYEIWNEPDLTCFWNGTEAELIELYVHTAHAIRSADPNARVGGVAMNGWHKGIGSQYNSVGGYIPPRIADMSSTIAHLIDTCVARGVPLDFVSFRFFTAVPGILGNAMSYFRGKLTSVGLPNCEIVITECNASSTYRETPIYHWSSTICSGERSLNLHTAFLMPAIIRPPGTPPMRRAACTSPV